MRFRREFGSGAGLSSLILLLLLTGCSSEKKRNHGEDKQAGKSAATARTEKKTCIAGNIEIIDMWLSPAVKGGTSGGYCTIRNVGDQPDTLLGVSSAECSSVQIHEMVDVEGVMTMRELKNPVVIAPGETFTLKPGGHHLMFMGLNRELGAGRQARVQMRFANAGDAECSAPVQRPGSVKQTADASSDEKKEATNTMGMEVYARYCRTCHREDGSGVGEIFPPLAGSDFLKDKDRTIDVIVNGLSGPVTVNGEEYNGVMSSLPSIYDNEQAAAVINYVVEKFGDGSWDATASDVEAIRKK